jgi:methionyl-tRNA formyltransferase
LKLLFCGTSSFALPALKILLGSSHEVLAVVTQPDRPRGRGQKCFPSAIKSTALSQNRIVWQPQKINDPASLEVLQGFRPEVIVVVAYGQILSSAVLKVPPRGCVNLHASLLPQYRGAAPIPWALLNGETRTGVTTISMDSGMDTGPILLSAATPIEREETAGALHDRLSAMGAELLLPTLAGLENGRITPRPQDPSQATYAPKIEKESGRIRWDRPARELFNLLRAFDPWPGAFTFWQGQLLKLFCPRFPEEREEDFREAPGTLTRVSAAELQIATKRGHLTVRELQMANRPRMGVAEFLRGHSLQVGVCLGE